MKIKPLEPSSQTRHQQQSRLLTLPVEIRETILTYTLHPTPHRLIQPHSRPPWAELYRGGKPSLSPPILSVCQQLHNESQQLICRQARLVVYPQAETFPQLPNLGIRKFVRHLDIAIPLLEQDSRISTRRSKATTLLACPPEKLASRLSTIFPNVASITLTICPMLSRSLPIMPYMTGRRNYDLRPLLSQSLWREKVVKARLQLGQKMTDAVLDATLEFEQVQSESRDALITLLQQKLAYLHELTALREVDVTFTTPLSRPSHNRPIIWTMQFPVDAPPVGVPGVGTPMPTTSASSAMLTRLLRRERERMDDVVRVLRLVLPQVGKVRLFRVLYWRGTVSFERVDLESAMEAEVAKLLRRRTIVGGSAATAGADVELESVRSRDED